MSERYQAGFITKTTTTPTGPYQSGAAPGVWTLDQQLQYQQQGVWPTAGLLPNYIEDVFSTYLYAGNSSTQTITNGVDLSTKGGLVWIKARNDADDHNFYDTARGAALSISSNLTDAQVSRPNSVTSFNTTGFSLGSNTSDNFSSRTYVSWTFRKQAKFFDVVTYTGNGTAGRTVSHSLGSVPGCIIVKRTDGTTSDWMIYHRSLGATKAMFFDTSTGGTSAGYWNNTAPTSTQFSLGVSSDVNANGGTYVAYLFAHDAGGFGASGSDNVISCGSYTGNGSTVTITLGYEPQWVLIKNYDGGASGIANWVVVDDMRGMPVESNDTVLYPNTSGAEASSQRVAPTATGFTVGSASGNLNDNTAKYIYIAIRRGPMRTPTSGTSVFSPIAGTFAATTAQTTNFPIDAQIFRGRRTSSGGSAAGTFAVDRLRGVSTNSTEDDQNLTTNNTSPENDYAVGCSLSWGSTGFKVTSFCDAESSVWWSLRRAPGFFDVVCYTGTGSATTFSHNLGAVPELMIAKQRNGTNGWYIYDATNGATKYLVLNTTAASATLSTIWNNTAPTSSVFSVGTSGATNGSGNTYVAYLFATVAGVSKVGSYTGTGTTLQVNCGFTGGARFVLIKRTDSTGDWYVWDSARGIVAGNDPYLLLNSDVAEVTNTDYVDTYSAGFEISSTAPAAINANGGTFIFLAIA